MLRTTKNLIAAAVLIIGVSTQASAQTIRLTAVLSGANEAPAAVLTGATGTVEVFVNVAAQSLDYKIEIFNIPTPTAAGHFHVGGPGLAGPVVVDLAPPTGVTNDFSLSGSASASSLRPRPELGIRTFEDFLQALAGEQIYVNIHTTTNPGGEIRGQLIVDRR